MCANALIYAFIFPRFDFASCCRSASSRAFVLTLIDSSITYDPTGEATSFYDHRCNLMARCLSQLFLLYGPVRVATLDISRGFLVPRPFPSVTVIVKTQRPRLRTTLPSRPCQPRTKNGIVSTMVAAHLSISGCSAHPIANIRPNTHTSDPQVAKG